MSFDWFRMWVDAVDDEKLKLLAFEDRWHFVALLCCKRKGILDAGDAPALRDRKVGAKLGLADRDRDEVRRRLIDVGLIDEDWQPLAWGKRQFISDADPTAGQRKKRQREKQRHGRVTRDNRDSHAQVTDESLEGHAPQTQTQTQTTDSEKKLPSEAVERKAPDRTRVDEVFEHWRSEHAHPKAQLDEKRRRKITAALKHYTAEQLCQAISGYRHSPHHMGTDPKGQGVKYDDIELFLRDSAHVENGLRLFAHPPRPPPKAENASARILKALNEPDRVIEHDPDRFPAISR